jgi:hypothetical protein
VVMYEDRIDDIIVVLFSDQQLLKPMTRSNEENSLEFKNPLS